MYTKYVDSGGHGTGSYRSVCPQHKQELLNSDVMATPSSTAAASAVASSSNDLAEIPVFLQWDGQSYKYVILPDHTLQFSQQNGNMPTLQRIVQQSQQPLPPQQQQTQSVPQSHLLLPRYDVVSTSGLERTLSGNNLHVVHIPDEDGTEAQQYYLVNVKSSSHANGEDFFEVKAKHSEYIDMYEMARSFTSSSRSTPSDDNDGSKASDTFISDIHFVDDDSRDNQHCDDMELLDSSPTVLNKDASLPSICPSSGLDMESPCMSQSTPTGESAMFPYDVIDKSELDVYIRGHDDLLLSTADREELILFPGVNMAGAGDGIFESSAFEYQDKDSLSLESPVIVESIESQYMKRNFFA